MLNDEVILPDSLFLVPYFAVRKEVFKCNFSNVMARTSPDNPIENGPYGSYKQNLKQSWENKERRAM
jgi:hypothetical protein